MKKILIIILVLVFESGSLFSQNELSFEEKNEVCQRVFNNLKKAKGLDVDELPQLKLVKTLPNEILRLAMVRTNTGEAFIEEESIDICFDELGKDSINGLAFILAHELAHYLKQHNVRHQFIEPFQEQALTMRDRNETSSGLGENNLEEIVLDYENKARKYNIMKNEAEADLEAGFIAYRAGYYTKNAGPHFLDKAYSRLSLDKEGGNYASLDERKLIIKNVGQQLDTLIRIFELGNYSMVIKDYDTASDCFEYVSKYYQGKDIYNNLGLLEILKVMQYLDPSDIKYALPLTLDLSIYKDFRPTRGGTTKEDIFNQNIIGLNKSIEYFKMAGEISNNYFIADLNTSVAYYLLYCLNKKEPQWSVYGEDPIYIAESYALKSKHKLEMVKSQPPSYMSNVYLQLAIVNHTKKLKERALDFLALAQQEFSENELIKINKDLIEKDINPLDQQISNETIKISECKSTEKLLGDKNFDQVISAFAEKWDFETDIKKKTSGLRKYTSSVFFKNDDLYDLYQLVVKKNNKDITAYSVFLTTKENYNFQTDCGISKTSNYNLLKEKYGDPNFRLELPNGGFLAAYLNNIINHSASVEMNGIIFICDLNNQIKEWVIYQNAQVN